MSSRKKTKIVANPNIGPNPPNITQQNILQQPQVKLSEPMEQCELLLKAIESKAEAGPFLEPVDWKTYGLLDYPQIIKTPMDLGTVHANLKSGKYTTLEAFARDVRQIWRNAMTYNRPDSDIYSTADKFKRLFERRFSKITKSTSRHKRDNEPQVSRMDQARFANLASALNSEDLGILIDVLQKECPDALNEDDEDEITIDTQAIDGTIMMNLIEFAESCLNGSLRVKM